jgi:hypothetical protein
MKEKQMGVTMEVSSNMRLKIVEAKIDVVSAQVQELRNDIKEVLRLLTASVVKNE